MRSHPTATLRRVATAAALLAAFVATPAASAEQTPPYTSGPVHEFGEMVDYPLAFPVGGPYYMFDTFYASRCCGEGVVHHAQDLMADKMTPVYAAATGTVRYVNWSWNADSIDPARCCTIAIRHNDGWETWYIHLNNDTPGTDDGQGWGIAPGILPGIPVQAGQLIGWVGDSGNAEDTGPHLHFELHDPDDVYVNPYQALLDADARGGAPTCKGLAATVVGDTDGDGTITGTEGDDVIVGTSAADVIQAGSGNDVICGLGGSDYIDAGPGDDRVFGGSGNDLLVGGDGNDFVRGDGGLDQVFGGAGDDVLVAGTGNDTIAGGEGNDVIRSGRGSNLIDGGEGRDTVDYRAARGGVYVDLGTGTGGSDALTLVEDARGSRFADTIRGDGAGNTLKGAKGDDAITGGDGDDQLYGGPGSDGGDGGEGNDLCIVESPTSCEG